jgi:hypothetical protein
MIIFLLGLLRQFAYQARAAVVGVEVERGGKKGFGLISRSVIYRRWTIINPLPMGSSLQGADKKAESIVDERVTQSENHRVNRLGGDLDSRDGDD